MCSGDGDGVARTADASTAVAIRPSWNVAHDAGDKQEAATVEAEDSPAAQVEHMKRSQNAKRTPQPQVNVMSWALREQKRARKCRVSDVSLEVTGVTASHKRSFRSRHVGRQ